MTRVREHVLILFKRRQAHPDYNRFYAAGLRKAFDNSFGKLSFKCSDIHSPNTHRWDVLWTLDDSKTMLLQHDYISTFCSSGDAIETSV
jgi:hypothetical protein